MNTPARQRALRPVVVAAGVVVAALVALVAALIFGGAANEQVVPGLGDAGTLTRWGLPVTRMVMDLSGTLTVGALLMAAVLLPGSGESLSPQAIRYIRGSSWLAAVWAGAAAVTAIFTVSDVLGEPVGQVMGNQLSSYMGQLPQGIALMIVVLLASMVALLTRTTTTPGAAAGLLVVGFVALLPPPLTGHSAASPDHELAVTGLALHVAALAPWVGGLAMLTWLALRGGRRLGEAVGRFSRMALWCYVAVGVSGVANAASRLAVPLDLFTSPYGQLVLTKMTLFAVLGVIGWWHRGHTLPAIADGSRCAFARLAAVEIAVMAATMGVAVALARTAPPPTALLSPLEDLLGYAMPPRLTLARVATLWRFDLVFAVLVVVAGGLYLAGVTRVRRNGDGWPVGRVVAWFAGLAVVVVATMSGLGTYGPVLFSVHMIQEMTLSMVAPILLVLGAPLTLAFKALRPAALEGDRGPREWLTTILHSRVMRYLGHPAVAAIIFAGGGFVLCLTSLFGTAMRAHLGNVAMLGYFLAAGSLFFWVVIGIDPVPHRLPLPARLFALFMTLPCYAILGIVLMSLHRSIGLDWYTSVHPSWAASLKSDQRTGGAIAWAFGDIPAALVLVGLMVRGRAGRRTLRLDDQVVSPVREEARKS